MAEDEESKKHSLKDNAEPVLKPKHATQPDRAPPGHVGTRQFAPLGPGQSFAPDNRRQVARPSDSERRDAKPDDKSQSQEKRNENQQQQKKEFKSLSPGDLSREFNKHSR